MSENVIIHLEAECTCVINSEYLQGGSHEHDAANVPIDIHRQFASLLLNRLPSIRYHQNSDINHLVLFFNFFNFRFQI